MNAESGDHEEEKDADVAERARELDQANRVLKEVVGKNFFALFDGVIKDDTQSRDARSASIPRRRWWSRGDARGGTTILSGYYHHEKAQKAQNKFCALRPFEDDFYADTSEGTSILYSLIFL